METASLNHVPTMVRLLCAFPSAFIGLACAIVFALRYATYENPRDIRLLLVTLCADGGGMLCGTIANMEGAARSLRYDQFIYEIDGLLGFQPSFLLGRLLLSHVWGVFAVQIVYGLISAAVMALLAIYVWRPQPDATKVIIAFLLNVILAPAIYYLLPVSGPRFAFATFPYSPGLIMPTIIHLSAAPNGIPSIHCSTAMLVWWYSRRWVTVRRVSLVNLVLVVISTLASGQHYAFDVLTSVPYTAAIVFLANACSRHPLYVQFTAKTFASAQGPATELFGNSAADQMMVMSGTNDEV